MSKLKTMIWSGAVAFGVLFVLAVGHIWAAPVAAPAADSVSVCPWLGCKPGAVSYTQDDASNIHGVNSCRPALEAAGFRGTFFYDGTDSQPWMAEFTAAGHEVGSHLANHLQNLYGPACGSTCTLASLRETPYTPQDIADFRQSQIDPNVTAIESETGQPVVSMAYPYGATDAARMIASESYFLGARGYFDADVADFPWITNTNPATPPDAMLLNSDGLSYVSLINSAISEGKWAILTMHDYCFGIVPGYDQLITQRNSLWVAPMGEVMKYIRVRDAARFGNYVKTYNTISFDAGYSLSTMQRATYTGTALLPIVFDNPVTLNVDIPIDKGVGAVVVDGLPVSYTVTGSITGTHSVLITATLEVTRNVAITLTGPNAVQLKYLTVRADTDPGGNLGWLLVVIVMGTIGLAGLLRASRRQQRS